MFDFSTVIADVDGTILSEISCWGNIKELFQEICPDKALPDVVNKLNEWKRGGNKIILITARPEFLRELTEYQLNKTNVPYDILVMDCGNNKRILINNFRKDETVPMAESINLTMNEGFANITLED